MALILFELWLIMIFSPVVNIGQHPLQGRLVLRLDGGRWVWVIRDAARSENLGGEFKYGGALCFEWSFTRTFPRNQDVVLK